MTSTLKQTEMKDKAVTTTTTANRKELSSDSTKKVSDARNVNIEEIAKDATPRQIREWIDSLEALYDEKKSRVRKDLQDRVTDLMSSNGYTIEELFGARVLPSAADLAEWTKQKESAASKDKDRLMDSVCHS